MDITTFSIHQLIEIFLATIAVIWMLLSFIGCQIRKSHELIYNFPQITGGGFKGILKILAIIILAFITLIVILWPVTSVFVLILKSVRAYHETIGSSLSLSVALLLQILIYCCLYKYIVYPKTACMKTTLFYEPENHESHMIMHLDYYKLVIICVIALHTEYRIFLSLDLPYIEKGLPWIYIMVDICVVGVVIINMIYYKKGLTQRRYMQL